MNIESTNKLVCRKCGGPHFTIKCGKDKPEPAQEVKPVEVIKHLQQNDIVKEIKVNEYPEKNYKREKFYSKKLYRVKLSELPKDMYEEEMMELTYEWGHIVKVKVINYDENSVAYIDFGFEDEANYFIEAIDKTPFESLLLSACIVESY